MARRKLDPALRRDQVVSFKLTAPEVETLASAARAVGCGVAEYVRRVVLERKVTLKAAPVGRTQMMAFLPLFVRTEASLVTLACQAHREMELRRMTREDYFRLILALDRAIAPLREALPW